MVVSEHSYLAAEGPSVVIVRQSRALPSLNPDRGRLAATSLRSGELLQNTPQWIADLYEREARDLHRTAFLLTSSRSDAEEIVHDVFVSILASRTEIRDPKAYLYRAIANRARSVHRHRRVQRNVAAQNFRGSETAPSDSTERVDILDALHHLSQAQRTAVVLKYFADCEDAEIARVLRCRPATVRSHLHRGIAILRTTFVMTEQEGST